MQPADLLSVRFVFVWRCLTRSFLRPAAETPAGAVRDQPDGRADAEGRHAVLRLRPGEAEGPLSQHALLKGEQLVPAGSGAEVLVWSDPRWYEWEEMGVLRLRCFHCPVFAGYLIELSRPTSGLYVLSWGGARPRVGV